MTKTNIIYVRKKSTEPIVRANDEQIKFLIDYMGRHKDFAAGRFIGVQGKIKLKSQWESLTNSLNEIGPTKSSEKWQNVWKNQKHIARQKNKNVRISQRQTGNISLHSELEEKEVAVLNIIGKETSIGFGLNEGFEHSSTLSFDQINTNINEYTDLEVALLDEEMNNEDNSEILDGNILKENIELHKSDYLSLKPSTSVNQTMDIPLQSSRRSNRDVPTMSNNSKKPKLDTYMDLVKGTNDGFIAIAASLDKLATAMQNSSELIDGLMNIADAISKHA